MSQARELFDAGAAALGLLGGGKPNQAQALRYFTAASEADPLMCDAWLGRMLCGDGESPDRLSGMVGAAEHARRNRALGSQSGFLHAESRHRDGSGGPRATHL